MRSWLTHLVVLLAIAASACREGDSVIGDRVIDGARGEPAPMRNRADDFGKGPDWGSAFTAASRWDAGKKAVVVDVSVAPGFHAYTTGETVGKPLLLTVKPESALKVAEVEYPKGTTKELSTGRSVIVEGKAEIVAIVSDPVAGKSVDATLRYQVCTPEACDRPRTVDLAVAVQ